MKAPSARPIRSRLEELQFTLGEGPCLDAYRSGEPTLEPDLAHPRRSRWPAMSAAALESGAAAIFGFPLGIGDARIGALDLYRDRPGPLNRAQHADALEMADIAAHTVLAMQADDHAGGLVSQLQGNTFRYLVHQAAGMLSVQLDVTVDDGLDRLRAYAFAHHRPIEHVASEIVAHVLRFD